jgi:hypothetical protein
MRSATELPDLGILGLEYTCAWRAIGESRVSLIAITLALRSRARRDDLRAFLGVRVKADRNQDVTLADHAALLGSMPATPSIK